MKTNQLQRIIRTGRTGHWLNHSKEHCLVGIKGDPLVNRNIDTDVLVAEVRETSRKPDEVVSFSILILFAIYFLISLIPFYLFTFIADGLCYELSYYEVYSTALSQMYPLLERISPRTRKLELFARMHNTQAGYGFLIYSILFCG